MKDLQELMANSGISQDTITRLMGEMRVRFAGDKIYVPAVRDVKKDAIAAAARHLPTGVVATRFGVSQSWVIRVSKRSKF